MASRADRDRSILAPLGLEQLTEKDEALVVRMLDSACRRRPEDLGISRERYQLVAARLDVLHRHLARRRLRVLPGGRALTRKP